MRGVSGHSPLHWSGCSVTGERLWAWEQVCAAHLHPPRKPSTLCEVTHSFNLPGSPGTLAPDALGQGNMRIKLLVKAPKLTQRGFVSAEGVSGLS